MMNCTTITVPVVAVIIKTRLPNQRPNCMNRIEGRALAKIIIHALSVGNDDAYSTLIYYCVYSPTNPNLIASYRWLCRATTSSDLIEASESKRYYV